MPVGAAGFVFGSLPLMFVALFAMGTHSALFGPVKYSILPQHLHEDELVGGNALVEMGTFLAILAGTIGAGVLMSHAHYAAAVATAVVLVVACGYLASRGIPRAAAALPGLKLDWNIFAQSWSILRLGLGQRPAVSRSLVGNSWFWFLGAVYLTQIPTFAKEWLHGDESVVTLILTVSSVGIALGSMLCEKLSGRKVEIGLVPFGSIGLDRLRHPPLVARRRHSPGEVPYDWLAVLRHHETWAVLADILFIGIFGGFYIVPLYALIQARTDEDKRARVIAANNILNALFMVAAALVSDPLPQRRQVVDPAAVPRPVADERRGERVHLQDRPGIHHALPGLAAQPHHVPGPACEPGGDPGRGSGGAGVQPRLVRGRSC